MTHQQLLEELPPHFFPSFTSPPTTSIETPTTSSATETATSNLLPPIFPDHHHHQQQQPSFVFRKMRRLHWRFQRPSEGRYWNMFRPFLSCSSSVRTCELPEGCRFVCNPEFLVLGNGVSSSSSSSGGGEEEENNKNNNVQQREIVGIGSNNEFDWEESLISLYTTV